MATEVNLPALGESVTEGTVTRWLKAVGDTVAVDEPLLEVSTDKVDTEIPSPVAGTLLEIKAEEDDTVEVGAVLALIGDESEAAVTVAAAPTLPRPPRPPSPRPRGPAGRRGRGREEGRAGAEIVEEKGSLPAGDETPESEKSGPAGGSGGGSGTSVTLPALGESVTEGTVTRWLKSVR